MEFCNGYVIKKEKNLLFYYFNVILHEIKTD